MEFDLKQLMLEGARSSSNSNSNYSAIPKTRRSRTASRSMSRRRSRSRSRSLNKTSLKPTSFQRSVIKPVEKKSVLKKKFNVLNQKRKLEIKFNFTKDEIKNNREAYNALKLAQDVRFLGRGAYGEVYRIDKNLVIKFSKIDNSDEAKSLRTVNRYEERSNFNECGKYKPRKMPKNSCCDKRTKKLKLGEQLGSFRYCKNGRYFPEIFFNGKDNSYNLPYWIIMGNVGNQTLEKYIENNKLTYTELIDIFKQICEALDILHKNRLFHGDLKLDNIMIGKNNQIIIIDLQCSFENAESDKSCETIATPFYMSPFKANSCVGFVPEITCQYRSDIWTIGIILFKILTGEFLTSGDNILLIVYKYGMAMKANKSLVENRDNKLFNNVLNKFCNFKIGVTLEQKKKLILLLMKLFDYKEEEKPSHENKKESFEGFNSVKEILGYLKEHFNEDLTIPVV